MSITQTCLSQKILIWKYVLKKHINVFLKILEGIFALGKIYLLSNAIIVLANNKNNMLLTKQKGIFTMDIKDLLNIADMLKKQTGDNLKEFNSFDEGVSVIYEFFKDHCSCSGYGEIIFDDGFIGIFEITQSFLIEIGKIRN